MPYTARNKVRIHDTDMAGILYFGKQFRFMHDCWEDLLEQEGHFMQHMFTEADYAFVIVHCEADYKVSFLAGDDVVTELRTGHIGTHAFTLEYKLFRDKGGKLEQMGAGKTVHCTIGRVSRQKTPIPDELRGLLERYR